MQCIHLLFVLLALAVRTIPAQQAESLEVSVSVAGDAVAKRTVSNPMRAPDGPAKELSPATHGHAALETAGEESRGDAKPRASLVVLQKELETLETMIELQGRKLQTLEKMRTALLQKADNANLEELGLTQRHSARRMPTSELEAAVDRRLEAVTAQVLAKASSANFDAHFIEKARVTLDDDVIEIKISKISRLPTQDLIAVGSRSGLVRLLLASGREVLRIDTHIKDMDRLDLDTSMDPPLLAVMSKGCFPRVRAFTLIVNVPRDSQEAGVSTAKPTTFSNNFQLSSTELLMNTTSLNAATSIAISRSSRRSMLSVAHSDGTIGFYALNGSLVHYVPTQAPNVSVLVAHRHLIAFANGTDAIVFPLTRQKVPDYITCEGSQSNISSVAFDPVHPDVMFIGTADGELLAFVLSRNSDASRCRLAHRTITGRMGSLQLVAFKGHVSVSSQTEIQVYSVTRSEGSVTLNLLYAKPIDKAGKLCSGGLVAVAENGHATIIGVISRGATGTALTVFQSLLPSVETSAADSMTWRVATFLIMITIVVLATQFFLRRQRNSHEDAGSEEWRDLLEKHGRRDRFQGERKSVPPAADQPQHQPYEGDPTMYSATTETFSASGSRKKRGMNASHDVDKDELRRKIAEARRETLECTFDDVEEDEY